MDYEHFGDYQPSEERNAGLGLTLLLVGIGIGTLAALLLAPRSGRRLRKSLRRTYEDARESLGDWGEQAGDVLGRGGEWARSARRKVAPIMERRHR